MAAEEVDKPPSLPPYPEMILAALEALNEKNGSNKTSISKHIESKYGELPAAHTTLLAHHLNKMKDTGELVFWKNNYMKADPNAPPRRGRGRPPKPKVPLPLGSLLSPARPRGRPPKDPNAPPTPKSVKPKVAATGSGKPRGRPRKMARPTGGMSGTTATTTVVMASGTGRPRGRPPKVKPGSVTEMILAAALDEKNVSNSAGHTTIFSHHLNRMKSTRELLFWKNNYMKAGPNAPPRRGRGRPPKPKVPLPPGTVVSPARPRGRPPKDQNAPPKPAPTGSGKPRGRPRKIAQSMEQMNGTTTATVPP